MNVTPSNLRSSSLETAEGSSAYLVWFLRAAPAIALAALLLALFVWKSGTPHNFCVGLAAGALIGLLVQTFEITKVEVKDHSRSDVQSLHITR